MRASLIFALLLLLPLALASGGYTDDNVVGGPNVPFGTTWGHRYRFAADATDEIVATITWDDSQGTLILSGTEDSASNASCNVLGDTVACVEHEAPDASVLDVCANADATAGNALAATSPLVIHFSMVNSANAFVFVNGGNSMGPVPYHIEITRAGTAPTSVDSRDTGEGFVSDGGVPATVIGHACG